MMDWMEELQAALRPPVQHKIVGASHDWSATERFLGRGVPQDYKRFVDVYGDGSWHSFILFFLPGDEQERYALPQEAILQNGVYEEQKINWPDRYRMPLLPDEGSLMPFARTENGDFIGWIVGPEDPDNWKVGVLAHEEGMVEQFDMSFAEFLTRLTTSEVKPGCFPASLDRARAEFHPAVPWNPEDG